MPESDDHRLLAEFVRCRSEAAFTELVRRYAGLVYSTAFRFCNNPHHAEEITQAVFIILARKAGTLSPRVVLSGWLYQTARLVTANFVKGEIRRRYREQEAVMQSTLHETDSTGWEKIAPLLDDAMGALGETDRNAVLLRYFENRTSSEIGVALRMNEETARKRVNRALEKLRQYFVKRGVTVSSAAISGAISANSVQPISAFMVKSISAVAIAKGAVASSSTLTLIKGALKIMAWTKAKTAVVAVAAVILATGTATVAVKTLHSGREKFTVESLDAKIARLSHPGATIQEVIQELGEPAKYFWEGETFNKGHLPENYSLLYSHNVSVWGSRGKVVELRSEGPSGGFTWHGKLRLGSTLDEVLETVGPPSRTVVGKPLDFTDGVLYRDIAGRKGYGYYSRLDQNVRFFFRDNKVASVYVVLGGGELDSFVPGEPIPDIDAKIARLSREGVTVEDAIRILGEPGKYMDGDETFQKNDLPERYLALYPGGIYVAVIRDRVTGLRSLSPGPGFTYHNLRLGSSLDDALSVLGQPAKTIVGAHPPFVEAVGVLYKDIDGKPGRCCYNRLNQDLRVRLYFYNNKATALEIEIPGNHPAARP